MEWGGVVVLINCAGAGGLQSVAANLQGSTTGVSNKVTNSCRSMYMNKYVNNISQ